MAKNKNQHFVPRSYLKRFQTSGQSHAISLYNFRNKVFVESASIKGQCAKSYLYGKDLVLEGMLSRLETLYIRNSAIAMECPVSWIKDSDPSNILFFTVIQMFRTIAAVEHTRSQMASMHYLMFQDDAPAEYELPLATDLDLIISNMKMAVEFHRYLDDLKPLLLINLSDLEFITSDSPAVATNRLYLQKFKNDNFGLSQSGVYIYLPISPKFAVIFYDYDVYRTDSANYCHYIRRDRDVVALNSLVINEARENIYFASQSDRHIALVRSLRDNAKFSRHSGATFAPGSKEDADIERYERVEDGHRQAGSMLYVSSIHYPDPGIWCSALQFAPKMIGYTNGSAVGYIRRHCASIDYQDCHKIDLRQAPRPPYSAADPNAIKGRPIRHQRR